MTEGRKTVVRYRFKGLKSGGLFGLIVGLTIVFQSFEAKDMSIEQALYWILISSITFAFIFWVYYLLTTSSISSSSGYDNYSDPGGSNSGGFDGGGE